MDESMIYIKTHISENGSVIAMCDSTLITETLEEGDILIDIKTYSSFYNGELVNKDRALKIIANADRIYSANLVGKESVEIGLEAQIIEQSNVLMVKKVPYAQAYRVDI
jgi:hypothetical protein